MLLWKKDKWNKSRLLFKIRAFLALGPVNTGIYLCSKMRPTCLGSAKCSLSLVTSSSLKRRMQDAEKCQGNRYYIG